jgi:hypothetical protein
VTGGFDARISKVSPTGRVTIVADRLPSSIGADGNTTYGIADVAFVRNELVAILQGGGCAHGHADHPLSLINVQPDGTWRAVADLGNYMVPQVESARRFKVDIGRWPLISAVDAACARLAAFRDATPAVQPDAN